MSTFTWKGWRIAWLYHASWGMRTTVYDGDGRWEKVFGPICILIDRGDTIYPVKQERQ